MSARGARIRKFRAIDRRAVGCSNHICPLAVAHPGRSIRALHLTRPASVPLGLHSLTYAGRGSELGRAAAEAPVMPYCKRAITLAGSVTVATLLGCSDRTRSDPEQPKKQVAAEANPVRP